MPMRSSQNSPRVLGPCQQVALCRCEMFGLAYGSGMLLQMTSPSGGSCIYSLCKLWPRQMIQSRMCSLGNLREDGHWWLAYRHRNQLNKDKSLAAFCGSANWFEGHAFPLWVWIEASCAARQQVQPPWKLACCVVSQRKYSYISA